MERRELRGNRRRYERYLPSASTLQTVGEKLNSVLRKRFGKIKDKIKLH